jgi:hypothetical protein
VQSIWVDYYRRRNWARVSVLAFPIVLFLIIKMDPRLFVKLDSIRVIPPIVAFFIGIGLIAVIISAPILRWTEWKCPECRNKFALPRQDGTAKLGGVFWNLFFDSRCGSCGLRARS